MSRVYIYDMTESKLKLPFDELRTLYMRHLLLQQLVTVKEVSLHALLLEFRQRRARTLYLAENYTTHDESMEAYRNIRELEDRYSNSVVTYHYALYASCVNDVSREQKRFIYECAYALLVIEEAPASHYYLGRLLKLTDWKRYNVGRAVKLIELSATCGFVEALIHLAHYYQQQAQSGYAKLLNYTKAISYYKEAILLNSKKAALYLACLLESKEELRKLHPVSFLDLYTELALRGNRYAIAKCVAYDVSITFK